MKRIVQGNDFRMRIPVFRIYNGEQVPFALPASERIQVRLCGEYRRIDLEYEIDVANDNVLVAKVDGRNISCGCYALEVRGVMFGQGWRSCEYEQIRIVHNNAEADTEFDYSDGEPSVEMDTALVILAADPDFYTKVEQAEQARVAAENLRNEAENVRAAAENERQNAEVLRAEAEAVRIANEELRQTAEAERKANEEQRIDNEAERIKNETERVASEHERISAEEARALGEQSRAAAETERQESFEQIKSEIKKAEATIADLTQQVETASGNAEQAVTNAQKAVEDANTAEERANAAAGNALTSARLADEATALAAAKAEQANAAAGNADRATVEAQAMASQIRTDADNAIADVEDRTRTAITNAEKATQDTLAAITNAEKATGATNAAIVQATKVNAVLDGSVVTITDNTGNERSIDLLDATEERVVVQLYSDVDGVSTAGLVLNVYYNDTDTPVQYTTDERGTAVFKVQNGNKYRIVYPDIEGCNEIPDVEYVAAASERTITEWYKIADIIDVENVLITFRVFSENASSPVPYEGTATITYGDYEGTFTADSNGQIRTQVPLGTEYTVTIAKPVNLHMMGGRYSHTYTADKTNRAIGVNLHEYLSSFLIVDKDGGEWTLDGWMQSGRDNSDAVLIHICTDELLENHGDFCVSIDGLREHKYDTNGAAYQKLSWCEQSVLFESIPTNGAGSTRPYYYDGLAASDLIIAEGVAKGYSTPAHSKVALEYFNLGVTRLSAFIISYGQALAMVNNATYIDEILVVTRPDGAHLYSTWTEQRWLSTQQSATDAYRVSRAFSYNGKYNTYLAVPAYAPSSL